MMKLSMTGAALAALAACATPVPEAFNGQSAQIGNGATLVIPSVPDPQPVPPPAPVRTTSLDGPASAPTPLPSTNGMPPPPVEVGVVGPVPENIPPFEPLVMDEDVAG